MELKWLEDFLALYTCRNFHIAAKQRNVSQPAFSRRIQSLESWVKQPLFDRNARPATLTLAGKKLIPLAQELVRLSYQVREDIALQTENQEAKIRFATLNTLAQSFMPTWLKQLQPIISAEQFYVDTGFGDLTGYLDALENNDVDFFVCYEAPETFFVGKDRIVSSLKLAEDALIPVVKPDADGKPTWWLPNPTSQTIPYLCTRTEISIWPVREHIKKHYSDLEFKTVYESNIATALKSMVLEGFGVAWIPYSMASEELSSGQLVRAAAQETDIIVDIKIYRNPKNKEPRLDRFWQAVASQEVLPFRYV
ncbi:MAG: LysR family transcriptional regulator [Rhizobiales bacterium]|nr:LysR substrate-binding domain-containing protein [Hyphomicrobiales bacterium]NRB13145.1 LysR family transcriptional regulator [Hyphomicrobiales bacterium]